MSQQIYIPFLFYIFFYLISNYKQKQIKNSRNEIMSYQKHTYLWDLSHRQHQDDITSLGDLGSEPKPSHWPGKGPTPRLSYDGILLTLISVFSLRWVGLSLVQMVEFP